MSDVLEYDKDLDVVNIEVFERNGLIDPMKNRHRCVLCRQPTSIDGSYSHSGHKLVCRSCLWTRFGGDIISLSRWQNGGD